MAALRILMVTRGVEPLRPGCGGAELAAEQLARTLARRGHHVTLVSDRDPAACPDAAGLVFAPIESAVQRAIARAPRGFARWLAQHLAGNVSAALAARRLLRAQPFDVVHAHGGLSAVLLARLARVPVVYTEHDAPPWQCRHRRWWERLLRTRLYRALNVRAFRGVSAVAATFDALAAELSDRWGVPAARVASIPNGADLDRFAIALPGAAPYERYCLFVGRLEPRKAPDLLLEALADAPGVRCVFAGDGPMRSSLERQ
ncbi:MAG TPA: glycosyltransferase family 4 protein, partial [Solirubrobacteraceae bacterium]